MILKAIDEAFTPAVNAVNYAGCFGDKRLENRGEEIARRIVEKETVVLNQLSNNRAELVGCSRFFNNDSVTEEALREESRERCKTAVKGVHVLAIQDTSEINYQAHRGKLSQTDKELGPVGNGKDIGYSSGFCLGSRKWVSLRYCRDIDMES